MNTNSNITSKHKKLLWSSSWHGRKQKKYLTIKVNKQVKKLKVTIKNSQIRPFKSGFRQKFDYITQIIPNISHFLHPTENAIWQELITSLFKGRTKNDKKRQLLSVPVKLCEMNITNITSNNTMKNSVDKIKNKKEKHCDQKDQ